MNLAQLKTHYLAFLEQGLAALSLTLTPVQKQQCLLYLASLKRWNQTYNLTAITDFRSMLIEHLFDSLSISPYITGQRIIDVGTGAGLPGIPLAIVHPDKYFVLLDARVKKSHFLTQMVYELGLSNVAVVCKRVENYHPDSGFSAILTRAFSSLNNMLKLTKHLKQPQGCFLAMKGMIEEPMYKSIAQECCFMSEAKALQVPFLPAQRHLLIIKDVYCG